MDNITHADESQRSLWRGPALLTALLLLLPVFGNRFVDGWNWEPRAFVALGVVLFGLGLTYRSVTRNSEIVAYRAAVGIAFATSFVLIWVNFVQGSDDVNPVPLAMLYLVVPLVGSISAFIARLRRSDMTGVLFLMAIAQAAVLMISLVRNLPVAAWTPAMWRGFGLNALFLVLFVVSGRLFRKAARQE